ncbi:MAG: hypothetical protein OIF50_16190 [Flavobacteriaceae bacterium]|nr:hypothetical protein [Flavobacteriaceae bacterium]
MLKYKLVVFGVLLLLLGCGDGDLTIETISFDEQDMETCDPPTLSTRVFFKTKENQSLILELPANLFKNQVSEEDIISNIGSASKLSYRIFNENVTQTYFCSSLPPSSPLVTEEVVAEAGSVVIKTVSGEDPNSFLHSISLKDISFIRENGDRITNLETTNFGGFETQLPESSN